MHVRAAWVSFALVLLVATFCSAGPATGFVKVDSVEVIQTDSGLEVQLHSPQALHVTTSELANPTRLVLDVADAVPGFEARQFKVSSNGVKQVRVGLHADPTFLRIVVDLTTPVHYTMRQDETTTTLRIESADGALKASGLLVRSKQPITVTSATVSASSGYSSPLRTAADAGRSTVASDTLIRSTTTASVDSSSAAIKPGKGKGVSISTISLPEALVGTSYSAAIQVSGGTPPYTWSLASGQLPQGLALQSTTGLISGVASQAVTSAFSVQVKDSSAQKSSASKSYNLAAIPPLAVSTSALPSCTAGRSYSAQLTASGGSTPYKWSVAAGQLPAGLSLGASGGITGTPATSGQFSFTAAVSDSSSPALSATRSYSVSVSTATPVSITTVSLPDGAAGLSYAAVLGATGGSSPYTWSVAAGSLPPGIVFNASTGSLSGTPLSAGTFGLTIQVADSSSSAQMQTKQFTIVIAAAALAIVTSALPDAFVGGAYNTTIAATGGTEPYTWNITSGTLPSSMALSATTGVIDGIPATSGTFLLTAQVTDAKLQTASHNFSLVVSATMLDQYGGVATVSCPNPVPTDWNMQKMTLAGKSHWVFCTPLGHPFIKRGVYYIASDGSHTSPEIPQTNGSYLTSKYGSSNNTTLANSAFPRLKVWGFNAAAPGSEGAIKSVSAGNQLAFTAYVGWQANLKCIFNYNCKDLARMRISPTYTDIGRNMVDAYDPSFVTASNTIYNADTNLPGWKTNPYFIGGVAGDGDWYYGFGAGPDFVTDPPGKNGWIHNTFIILQSAPRQTTNPWSTPAGAVFSDATNFSKAQFVTFLQGRYASLAALNTAWGASYTSWGTTGAQVTGLALAGSGTSWSGTLTRTTSIDRYSVLVKADGVAVGGDNGTGTSGSLRGSGIAGGTINYATGAISVTLNSSATSVTIDYYHDGWGVGTGVLDEAANGHAWLSIAQDTLSGSTVSLKTDFDDFLTQYAEKVFRVQEQSFHAIAPTKLFFGTTYIGGWRTPGRCAALKGVAHVVDVVTTSWDGSQAQANYIDSCTGNKPFSIWYSINANPESEWYDVAYPDAGTFRKRTQAERAAYYQNDFNNFWSVCSTVSGTCGWVGIDWWAYYSQSYFEHMNWGLVSWRDNAYDGREAITENVACSAPTGNYRCGGEVKNYGNFIGPVATANKQIDSNLTH